MYDTFLNVFVWNSFKGNSNCSRPFIISGAKRDPCSLKSFFFLSSHLRFIGMEWEVPVSLASVQNINWTDH